MNKQANPAGGYVAERQQMMLQWQRVVCYLLGISTERYATMVYEAGMHYLRLYVKDPMAVASLAGSRIYWGWWRNQWALRDQQFINSRQRGDTVAVNTDDYLWLHNPRVLAGNIHPNSLVLTDAYAAMMGEVIKQEVAQ